MEQLIHKLGVSRRQGNAVDDGYEKFPDRFVRKKLLVDGLVIF